MSRENKEIQGDVNVAGHTNVGGDANVQGSVRVGHNLRVEGWLEAPNIKGAQKGMFLSAEQLEELYPKPQGGWWALVGSKIPAQVYVVSEGKWVGLTDADGRPVTAGEPKVDLNGVPDIMASLEALEKNVTDLIEDLRDMQRSNTLRDEAIVGLCKQAEEMRKRLEDTKAAVVTVKAEVENINASKGIAGGFAPLGEDGIVPREHLPQETDYLHFNKVLMMPAPSVEQSSTTREGAVVWNPGTNTFVKTPDNRTFYSYWPGATEYGTETANGIRPKAGRLYLEDETDKLYKSDGLTITAITESAKTVNEIFNEVSAIERDVDALKKTVETHTQRINGLSEQISDFDGIYTREEIETLPAGIYYNSDDEIFVAKGDDGSKAEAAIGDLEGATLYKCGDRLYHFNGGKLVRYVDESEAAKAHTSLSNGITLVGNIATQAQSTANKAAADIEQLRDAVAEADYASKDDVADAVSKAVEQQNRAIGAQMREVNAAIEAAQSTANSAIEKIPENLVTSHPAGMEYEKADPNLVTDALRKTPQSLSEDDRRQVLENLGHPELKLLIDLWREAGGDNGAIQIVDGKCVFELNKLILTSEEAMKILSVGAPTTMRNLDYYYASTNIRTNLPVKSPMLFYAALDSVFSNCKKLETAACNGFCVGENMFFGCTNLKRITGRIVLGNEELTNAFSGCESLEDIESVNVYRAKKVSFADCPRIKLETLARFLGGNMQLITVHPEVYAKLTDTDNTEWNQLLVDAAGKNIQFATV